MLRGTGNGCGRGLKRLGQGQPGNTPVRVRLSLPRPERASGDSVPPGRRQRILNGSIQVYLSSSIGALNRS